MVYDLCARIPQVILARDNVLSAIREYYKPSNIQIEMAGQREIFSFLIGESRVRLFYIHEDKSPCVFESKLLNCDYKYNQLLIFELPKDVPETIYIDLTRFCKYLCDHYSCPMLVTLDFEYEICYLQNNAPVQWAHDIEAIRFE